MEVESETDGTFTFDENQSKNEIITKNEFVENSSAAEEKRKFFAGILVDVYQDIYLLQSKSKFLNDVELQCKDGEFLYVPSVLLAAISPLFRFLAPVPDLTENYSLVLPDVEKKDFETFFEALCHLDHVPTEEKIDKIDSVMGVLCVEYQAICDEGLESIDLLDQVSTSNSKQNLKKQMANEENKENEPDKSRRRVGRKKGQKVNAKQEPYIKTEITDSHRTSAIYGLRTTIKRKKFTDELSDPSDLDDDQDTGEMILDSSDEYAPDEERQFEEESESEDEIDDDILEEDSEIPAEETDLLSSDDEIMDASIKVKKEFKSNNHDSFTVRMKDDGSVEVMSQDEVKAESSSSNKPRPRGRPRKRPKLENSSSELIGIGRVISVLEDEDPTQLAFKGKKIYASVKSDPKSLLKPSGQAPVPLILFCSVCEAQCNSQSELRHHVAKNHKGSKFFTLPKNNPHRDCLPCNHLLKSYEKLVEQEDPTQFTQKDVCFPCPHCRRRYLGGLGGLTNHLINDHRNTVSCDLGNKSIDYFRALKRSDPSVLTCDFCKKSLPHSAALNKHLISCPDNDSGCSAGLFCHFCGKMFAQQRYLKDHLSRHGKDQVNRPRNFMCKVCPVTCISEANLNKHIDREHSTKDPDENFILHEDCQRCAALYQSYIENKTSLEIPFRDMVFKCPHCCTVLYANHKHAPRYLYNHIHKFHTDPDINDFTLGGQEPSDFRLRSKNESDVLTCEFCGFTSKTRANHNVHLSTCKQSTVTCRPGYMCEICNFIAGSAVHVRNHMETHNDPKKYQCPQCDYTGRSKRYLLSHIKNHHMLEGRKKVLEANHVPCPKCGKLKREGPSLKSHLKKCGTGPARVTCTQCDMEFKRKEDMQAHVIIHYGQITCPIHNILFKQESEVFQHVNTAEPDDKFPKLECCMCGRVFKHMCIFMKHMRRHLRIAPYRCNECGKMVNTYASLALHKKKLHGNEKDDPKEKIKPFKCDECGRSFGSKGHLNEHTLGVHSQAPVSCPICQKSFNTEKRMRKHLLNSHKEHAEEFRTAWKSTEPFQTITIKFNQV